jgi:pimeloyl-ACP methyl ester carboxylesterase
MRMVETPLLDVAVLETGRADGPAAVLLHGFPYDPHAFDAAAASLAGAGLRVIVPYLRGHGPTRFRDPATPRSGQQAALGADLLALLDAMGIGRAVLAGYDWGGRAACVVAALWPERVAGLVTVGGYNIQDIAGSAVPAAPEQEWRYWYQYYFHTPRGEAGLTRDRRGIARLLWRLWSPPWDFDDATFDRSAAAFDSPDWVPVVIQSYRHRYGYAPGDPALEPIEARLAAAPAITVPTIILHGAEDGVSPPPTTAETARFTALRDRTIVPGAGHNLPQETPEPFVRAVLSLRG